jgi:DNA invertase Pin-like site-specific DNA recombinase
LLSGRTSAGTKRGAKWDLSQLLASIVQKLEQKQVDLLVLEWGIDATSMCGQLQFKIVAAIGEFKRELIRERSLEGRMRALARGVKFGVRPKLMKQEIAELINDYETPGCSKTEMAARAS